MENCKIDRTILSTSEMQAILSGLQSLDSISETGCYRRLMEKLSIEYADMVKADNHILLDLSRWDKAVVAEKIGIIKTALNRKEQIVFMYYFSNGKRGEQLNHTIWYSSGQVGMCGDIVPCGRIIVCLNWPI